MGKTAGHVTVIGMPKGDHQATSIARENGHSQPNELKLSDKKSKTPSPSPHGRTPVFTLHAQIPQMPLSYALNDPSSPVQNGAMTPPTGRLAGDVYDSTLPWWRAAIRRHIVRSVERETPIVAWIQVRRGRKSTLTHTHLTLGFALTRNAPDRRGWTRTSCTSLRLGRIHSS
jgi:hypothetical protein